MISTIAEYVATLPHRQALAVGLCMAIAVLLVNLVAVRMTIAANGRWHWLVRLALWTLISYALVVVFWIVDRLLMLGIWT